VKRRHLVGLVVLLLILIVSACRSAPAGYRLAPGETFTPVEGAATPGANDPEWSADWPMYLYGLTHSSRNAAATAITPESAADLSVAWRWRPEPPTREGQPPAELLAPPSVVGGRLYVGANTGVFYALDASTGTVLWRRALGYAAAKTCGPRGIASTPAIANDASGDPIVYVGGGDGNAYALRASDGAIVWKASVADSGRAKNAGYVWSSPVVVNGRVYAGVSSQCGNPQIRGGEKVFDQETGAQQAAYWVVPGGAVGGSIASSAAVAPGGDVFVTTGNADRSGRSRLGDSDSIVRLDGSKLAPRAAWRAQEVGGAPRDFHSSPTLFGGSGTPPMVGACNKDGVYYAFRRERIDAGPAWGARISADWLNGGTCLGGAVSDPRGARIYVAGGLTTVNGNGVRGSVRALDARTGRSVWQRGLGAPVSGTASLNGAGVLAVPSAGQAGSAANGVYLLDARTGRILGRIATGGSPVFAQPVFSDRYLFVSTQTQGLLALASNATPDAAAPTAAPSTAGGRPSSSGQPSAEASPATASAHEPSPHEPSPHEPSAAGPSGGSG
jgi:outer membrane protein assembly factor BamB